MWNCSGNSNNINFMDSAAGIQFFKDLKEIQNESRFVGTILIRVKDVKTNAVIDFIERFFDKENISFEKSNNGYYWGPNDEIRILLRDYNMPLKEDVSTLLNKCVILNTYMSYYFLPKKYVDSFEIIYRVDCYNDSESMYQKSYNVNLSNINGNLNNTLFINDLVVLNTEAINKVKLDSYNNYVKYDYIFTELSKNLNKEASK